ncbi:MAG: single-stranded DNA-binding protein [Calditrichaeota bacterium]|nr:single-stranded DNA-binding protein [Calditrichota bacterium]
MAILKMPDINNVIIAGNLTCDPSFRKTKNGTPVANFFIASNRKFKDNNGNWRENVCYIGVVAWYKLAESCYENINKGSAVIVDGELQSRSWKNPDGTSHNVIEIKARRIQFLNKRALPDSIDTDYVDVAESEEVELVADDSNNSQFENEDLKVDSSENSEQATADNADDTNEETDFDFGYQDLEL